MLWLLRTWQMHSSTKSSHPYVLFKRATHTQNTRTCSKSQEESCSVPYRKEASHYGSLIQSLDSLMLPLVLTVRPLSPLQLLLWGSNTRGYKHIIPASPRMRFFDQPVWPIFHLFPVAWGKWTKAVAERNSVSFFHVFGWLKAWVYVDLLLFSILGRGLRLRLLSLSFLVLSRRRKWKPITFSGRLFKCISQCA